MIQSGTTVANEWVRKHPKMPSITLARAMFAQHRLEFPTLNAAYSAIRRRRGAHGQKNRKYAPEVIARVANPNAPAPRWVNRFDLPAGDLCDFMPFVLGDDIRRLGILSDLHIPYHDAEAVHVALTELKRQKVDTVLLNGDLIDCHMLSRFEHDPNARDFHEERDAVRKFFQSLEKALPNVSILWKLGNHEERFESFMRRRAPELFGLDEFTFEALFAVPGVEIIGHKKLILLDRLTILHGHEYTARGITEPVNPARGMFLRAKDSVLVGHWHQPSQHTEPTVRGRPITCWSTGCLCDLHPNYMPLNKWRHGFAVVTRDHGKFRVDNRTIIDGELV